MTNDSFTHKNDPLIKVATELLEKNQKYPVDNDMVMEFLSLLDDLDQVIPRNRSNQQRIILNKVLTLAYKLHY